MSRKLAAPMLLAAALALPLGARAADNGAPMCTAAPNLGADHAAGLTRLQEKLAAEEAMSGGDVVVLNGRGYRYDQKPGIARDLHLLEVEIERARAAARAEAKP